MATRCDYRQTIAQCTDGTPGVDAFGASGPCVWNCFFKKCGLESVRPVPQMDLVTLAPVIVGAVITVFFIFTFVIAARNLHGETSAESLDGELVEGEVSGLQKKAKRVGRLSLAVFLALIIGALILIGGALGGIADPILDQCTKVFGLVAEVPFYIGMIFLILGYILAIVSLFFSPTMKYLKNLTSENGLLWYLNNMRSSSPVLQFHATCYHYETRTVPVTKTETDSHGKSHTVHTTETRTERVTTHSATEQFKYTICYDNSAEVPGMNGFRIVMVSFEKKYQFADEYTRNVFNHQYQSFRGRNNYDQYQDYSISFSLPGYKEYMMCWNANSPPPYYVSPWFCILATLGLCGPLYEFWLSRASWKGTYTFVKTIGIKRR
ncbi:TMEM151 family-domain-containing protein [Obelidium mucronatum]|nr:TMEM151 family-domain-containing protein [Obelidium mucronatum]